MRSLAGGEDFGRPDKLQVQRSFSQAAGHYDRLAGLQRSVAGQLMMRLAAASIRAEVVLDAGTGTGYCLGRVGELCAAQRLIGLDLSEGMLRFARRPDGPASVCLIAGDVEALPIADCSVDLIVSNLALQWCPDPVGAFREFARVLRPRGGLFFSSFAAGTLRELGEAWSRVDEHSHVNGFSTMDDLGRAMDVCGLERLSLQKDRRVVEYADVLSLMRELKGLGAHNVTADRPRHLVGKRAWANMISSYRLEHSTVTGGIQATFEVVIGTAKRRVC